MPSLHPFRQHASNIAGMEASAFLDALVEGTEWTLPTGESLIDYDFSVGTFPLAINNQVNGVSYSYDPDDSTSAPDIDILVSADGRRYKSEAGTAIGLNSVISRSNDTPDTPNLYDAYLVGIAPADPDWSGQANNFALFTSRGWVFAAPYVGTAIYVENIGENLQQDVNGDWIPFGTSVGIATIGAQALKRPMGMSVEGIFNDPPVGPIADQFYLVGMVPIGDFAGQTNKIAYYYDSAWGFIAPQTGDYVFDKAQLRALTYVGGWQPAAVSPLQAVIARIPIAATKTDTTEEYNDVLASFSYQGNTQRILRFRFVVAAGVDASFRMNTNSSGIADYELAIYRDDETGPVHQFYFFNVGGAFFWLLRGRDTQDMPATSVDLGEWPVTDALNHTYKLRIRRIGGGGSQESSYNLVGTFICEDWLV